MTQENKMIVLSDTREAAARLSPVPFSEGWAGSELAASELPPVEARLWRATGSGDAVWRAEVAAPPELAAWSHVVAVAVAGRSQFDALRELGTGAVSLPGGVVGVAGTGSGFHGQRGRSWRTARGNLHLSVVCDPELAAASCGLAMTALPAVATVEALRRLGPWRAEPQIKWVNDVVMAGRKVGGVLTATQSLGGRLSALVLGIGLNVRCSPQVPSSVFVPEVGNLADLAAAEPPSLRLCLAACLERISHWLGRTRESGPGPLLDAYRRYSLVLGREVCVWRDDLPGSTRWEDLPEPAHQGRVAAIADDLTLRLSGQNVGVGRGRLALRESLPSPGSANPAD
jgi:biotin-(acetyl-CoA carboxylase) ligase